MGDYQPKYCKNSEWTEMEFTGDRIGEWPIVPTLESVRGIWGVNSEHIDEPAQSGADQLRHFCEVLEALGMETELHVRGTDTGQFAFLSIKHPSIEDARAYRSRNAGRKPTETPSGSPLDGLAPKDALQWLYSHTPSKGCEALGGVSERTRKRRIAELRKQVEREQ